jgi:putative endonuclease
LPRHLSAPDPRASRGARAEQAIADEIASRGWTLIDRNFRTRYGEIDLVALDGDVLVFVEVRARTGTSFGVADETVGRRKLERIMSAALSYIEQHPEYAESWWRVDLFAITLNRAGAIIACRQYENLTLD